MNIVFFEENRTEFLPLVYTKPLAKIRFGILTIEEKWLTFLSNDEQKHYSYLTEDYLSKKFPAKIEDVNIYINSRFCPNERIADFIINNLNNNEAVCYKDRLLVAKCSHDEYVNSSYFIRDYNENFIGIELIKITDLFTKNAQAIEEDFKLITKGKTSKQLSSTNTLIGNNIFIEEGAKIEAAILNSTNGPIYIGKDSEIMEGSLVRGPFALCEGGVLKMGTKAYESTTVGKYSKVGGEVNNVVFQDYSNKGHDGFLGNSIIGEWCNLGADTNSSNLKNNYSEVKIWSYTVENYENTGLQFCGLIMGDHSKSGINTMFNTGTVVGVNANVFGADFPPKFIPSYSWGGASGLETFDIEKSYSVAKRVMERREIALTDVDKDILTDIFKKTARFRK